MSNTNAPPKSSSAQSNDQLADPATSPLSAAALPHQPSALLRLPNELLFQILEDPVLDRNDMKAVALSSSHLFQLARPQFYKKNYEESHDYAQKYTFEKVCNDECFESLYRQAMLEGDIPLLQRCITFGGGDVAFYTPCPTERRECTTSILEHMLYEFESRSQDIQEWSRNATELCLWLHEYQVSLGPTTVSEHECDICEPVPERDPRGWVITRLYIYYMSSLHSQIGPVVADHYFKLIQALFENGARVSSRKELLFHDDLPEVDGVRDASIALVHDGTMQFWGSNRNPMALSLEKSAPASLLELTIQQFRREGISIRSHHKLLELRGVEPPATQLVLGGECEIWKKETEDDPDWPQCETCDYSRPVKTELTPLLKIIYCSLFLPQQIAFRDWPKDSDPFLREEYDGQLADDLERKIDILDLYDVITSSEREGLQASVARLREVYRIAKDHGSYDFRQIGPLCWTTLFPSIPFPFRIGVRDNGETYFKPRKFARRPRIIRRWIFRMPWVWSSYAEEDTDDEEETDEYWYAWRFEDPCSDDEGPTSDEGDTDGEEDTDDEGYTDDEGDADDEAYTDDEYADYYY